MIAWKKQRFRDDVGRRLYDIKIRLSKIEETPIGEAIKLYEPVVFPKMKGV